MAPRRVPTRSCVVCRTPKPKRDLLRVVRTPGGQLLIDRTGRLDGRGAYLCHDGPCISQAITKGALGRALAISLPSELRAELLAGATDQTINEGGARGQE